MFPIKIFWVGGCLGLFKKENLFQIYRNGMDVALSLHHRNMKTPRADKCRQPALKLKPAGLDLWQQYVAQAFSFESLLGERMLTLQFEKLVSCDEKEVEKLERFTGLELRGRIEAMADQKRTARYLDPEHEDLVRYAGKMEWMKKLGYCAEGSLA
jgi:hypothetical protein